MTLIERIHQEINSYKNLKDGWESQDSFAPPIETINNSINFVNSLGNLVELIDEDYIYPTGDGTIVIDFQNDNGDLVSVEIRESTIGYFFETEGHIKKVDSDNITNNQYLSDNLKSLIEKVYEPNI
jgi:hypothetical protein